MTVRGYSQGHQIEHDVDNKWIYSDTKESISIVRECVKCKCKPTKEGYDSCLGFLKDVSSACCGHGAERPFAVFNDGRHMEFENAKEMREYFET